MKQGQKLDYHPLKLKVGIDVYDPSLSNRAALAHKQHEPYHNHDSLLTTTKCEYYLSAMYTYRMTK